ncbi:DNA internalization-related competence protein ComEC/Rec2 [Virgibacillus alimentarius]|uniref:DNA internalization-related competence protein ComEC/Rec2 n=1 Tax=Virgibacillus alimentarius TaxID=698769 RepID=UPI0004937E6F|nr:DNA internalization-related competence protein ComEC/Rec2 [Virgibacillus alimentarius]
MRGYWHFAAFSVVVSILTIYFKTNWFIVGFFLWLLYLYYYRKLGSIPIIMSIISFLFYWVYIPNIDVDMPRNDLISKETSHSGKITSPISLTSNKVEFLFQERQTQNKVSVIFFPDEKSSSKSFLKHTSIKHGAKCIVHGELELPEQTTNPGQFDFHTYLLKQGITHQIILQSFDDIECHGGSRLNQIFTLRDNLLNYVNDKYSKKTSSWLNALVLGDDSFISEQTVDLFQRWNLSHILAISGLHVGLVVALLYFLLIKLNILTKEKAKLIMIFFLPLYALLAGGEPSVWRASLSIMIFIILNKAKLKFNYTDVLSIVFLLFILFDKYIVYHVGFQLSFIVTFGLILSKNWIAQSNSSIFQLLQISFVSQMMILPLQLSYFSTFQPLSILLNVIVVPYFSIFVIPLMFIFLFLSPFPVSIVKFLDYFFVHIHSIFIHLVTLIDKHADYPWIIGNMPIVATVLYYVLFFMLMKYLQSANHPKAFTYGCSISLLIVCLAFRPYLSPIGTVTMLDIGQGDAFVIELPYRKGVIFVDAGANFTFNDFGSSDKVYKQIIKPYLYSRGINYIDAIFLSHEDIDHMGSVEYILRDMKVKEVIISDYYELDRQTVKLWKEYGTHIRRLNDKIDINGQVFQTIGPTKDMKSPNENSLILYTKFGGMSWLFTGDSGKDSENEIIDRYQNLAIDVLKVGHHGSRTSTSKIFVNQLDPSYALISVGKKNTYGHPSADVLEILEKEKVQLFRTDLDGAVQFRYKNTEGTFYKFLP